MRHGNGDVCIEGMDREQCLRKIRYLEDEAKETKKKQQDLKEQLCAARAQLLEQRKEVCNLQHQLLQELGERQRMARKVVQRELELLRLQESLASSPRALDNGDKCALSSTTAESCCSSRVGSSNVASGVSLMPADDFHIIPVTTSYGSILPTSPKQGTKISPQTTTSGAWQWKSQSLEASPNTFHQREVMATSLLHVIGNGKLPSCSLPTSPLVLGRGMLTNCSPQVPLTPQSPFQFHEAELPAWTQPCPRPIRRFVSQPVMQSQNMPAPLPA